MSNDTNRETATLAGGCFWCLEAAFEQLRGVESVKSGYAGGDTPNPTYREVCGGQTGHAEVVQIRYDPSVIGYRDLLEVFFTIHDPTTLNRQGADVGTQYRSAIFYHDDNQKRIAEEVIAQLTSEQLFDDPIVTQVVPLSGFFPAEEYHDQYYRRNSEQSYCQVVIAPKLVKLKKKYAEMIA